MKGPPRRQRDRRQVVAHLVSANPASNGVPLAELSVVVIAPALDVVVVQEGARVVAACGHLYGSAAHPEVDGSLTNQTGEEEEKVSAGQQRGLCTLRDVLVQSRIRSDHNPYTYVIIPDENI